MLTRPRAHPVALATACVLLLVLAAACGSGSSSSAAAGAPPATTPSYKITVAGDSISVGLGASLRGVVGDTAVVKVIGEQGTGLARPDTFDWPKRLTELARDFPPQVLVFSVGSNDAQDLVDANGKVVAAATNNTAWDAEYSRRLAASFDAFANSSTKVVWVGHVRTKEDRVGLANRHVHQLATAVAASRPFVTVTDLATMLGTGEQKADRCLIADGLHLSVPCLDEAAKALDTQMPAR